MALVSAGVARLAIARLVSDAGSFGAMFVGIWGKSAFRLHATPAQMAVEAASLGVSAVVGGLVAGLLVDRTDPRRVLIAGELIVVPSVVGLALAESIWPFIAIAFAAGFATGIITTAVASFAPYLAGAEGLARTNVVIEAASSLAMVAGPAVGAGIAKARGIDAVFLFDAITSLAAVALLGRLRVGSVATSARQHPLAELRDGLRFAVRHRAVRLYVSAGAAIWFSFGAFSALEALFYRDVLRSGPALLGWVLSVFGGGLLAGALLLGRLPHRLLTSRTLVVCILVMAGGEVLYVATDTLALVLAGNVVWGIAMGAAFPLIRTLAQAVTPGHLVGRVMGTAVTLNRAMAMLPLLVVGALASVFGVQRVLVGAGAMLAALVLLGIPEARRVDAMEGVAPAAAAADPDIAYPASRGAL